MSDRLTREARSAHMARIRRANTKPELTVRKVLHSLGYRFRIQLRGVPGRPDIALPGRRKAIFVHGCFWHAHEGCHMHHVPKSRTAFWADKFQRNRERDARLLRAAHEAGWECLVIWECEVSDTALPGRLQHFLGPTRLP